MDKCYIQKQISSKCFSVEKGETYLLSCRLLKQILFFSCQIQKTIFHAILKSKVSSATYAWRSISFKTAKAHTTTTSMTSQENLKTVIANTELDPVDCSLEPSLLSHHQPNTVGRGLLTKDRETEHFKDQRMTCYYINLIPVPTEPGILFNVQT